MSFDQEFKFNIVRSKRRTCAIQIDQYGQVVVRAPNRLSDQKIMHFIGAHRDWVISKLKHIQANPKKQLQYLSGERHYYLGKPYILDLKSASEETVGIIDDYFTVLSPDDLSASLAKTLMYDWYRQQAQKIFWERFESCYTVASFYNVGTQPTLRIKQLKSRWGSCSSKKNINLNLELIKAPIECIDQVIFHEMCHLRHMNHSRQFYDLLTQMMPDWKQYRARLKLLSKNF